MPIKDWSKYPPNWKEIRARILKRSQNKCEQCGLENYSEINSFQQNGKTIWSEANSMQVNGMRHQKLNLKKVKVILTIAHLDHDETNHDVKDERLAAMCQLCHLRYDAPEKARRKKAKKIMPIITDNSTLILP